MKYLLFVLSVLVTIGEAKAYLTVDLNDVCANNDGDETRKQNYRVGATSLEFSQKDLTKLCNAPLAIRGTKDWNLNVYFGPFLAYYNETEMVLKTDTREIQLSHVNPTQRHSMMYYDVTRYKKWTETNNPAQIFDEPQNRLTVEYQNISKSFSIGIEYIHPKIIFMHNENWEEFTTKNPAMLQNMGTSSDQRYVGSVTTTKSNVIFNLYLNKRFELVNVKDKFKVEYIAGAGIGFHGSQNMFEFHNEDWHREEADENWNVQGVTANLQNRIEISLPQTRFSLRLGHDLAFIRYDAKESGMRIKTNIWGQFFTAQLGIRLSPNRNKIKK